MNIQIKCRFSGKVLFEHDCENNTLRLTVEAAVKAHVNLFRAYLYGANLAGANLTGANLAGANLAGAYLSRANLASADLSRANLSSANLAGANLAGAYLAGAYLTYAHLEDANLAGANLAGSTLAGAYLTHANLSSAYLSGANLTGAEILEGDRPIFQIGPIGSRCAYLVSYITNKGLRISTGCFFGTVRQFKARLKEEHGDNIHAQEYKAALTLINNHYKLWKES